MSEKKLVCHGAVCKCSFGDFPDKLVVSSQQKHYINDTKGSQKLMATDKELGTPFQAKTFGQCKMQPTGSSFKPCMPAITTWNGFFEKTQIQSNQGFPLLEDSKGICSFGGAPSVEITFHGQVAVPSAQNIANADSEVMSQIMPLININEIDEPDPYDALQVVDGEAEFEENDTDDVECIAVFATCSDYMDLNRQERRGDIEPDTTKLYGFDWMRKDYNDNYGYSWDGRSFVKDASGNLTTEAKCDRVASMNFSDLQEIYGYSATDENNRIENTYAPEEEYYIPWLSILPNATVRVNLKIKWRDQPTEIRLQYNNAFLTVTHEKVTANIIESGTKKIEDLLITCNTPFAAQQAIEVYADNVLVGKLNIVPNATARPVNIGWCFVGFDTEDNEDIKNLEEVVDQQKLNKMLSYLGLRQALLEVNVAPTRTTLNIPQSYPLNQYLVEAKVCTSLEQANTDILAGNVSINDEVVKKSRHLTKTINGRHEVRHNRIKIDPATVFPLNITNYNTPKDWTYDKGINNIGDENAIVQKIPFKEALFQKYIDDIGETDGYDIVLVFVNKNAVKFKADGANKKITATGYVSGEAQAFNSKFVVIYKGFKEMVMVHEVLHAMSLRHSFDAGATHSFKAYKTKNIMDYTLGGETDKRESLWKWQWQQLWEWYTNK